MRSTSGMTWKCLRIFCIGLACTFLLPALASDNPIARGTWGIGTSSPPDGAWNGTDLERRSSCTSPQNDGSRGTYAEFDVATDRTASTFGIDQKGITGLNCTYTGRYSGVAPMVSWTGTYSCTDGKHGTFTTRSILVTQNALSIHLDVQLDTTETCKIEKVIAAGRLYP